MNLRNNIFILLTSATLMLMMLAGCVSVEHIEKPKKEMSFKAITSIQTRANTVPKFSDPFGLFANYTPDPHGTSIETAWQHSDFWTSKGDLNSLYINNGCFNRIGQSYIGVDPQNMKNPFPYFWPKDGSLMFSAYSPYITMSNKNIEQVKVRNYNTAPIGLMQIDVNLQKNAETTFDLLYTNNVNIGANHIIDENTSVNKTFGDQSATLPMVFNHAQCKVSFKFINQESNRKYHIKAELLNYVYKASFFSGLKIGWLPDLRDKAFVPVKNLSILNRELTANEEVFTYILIPMQMNGIYQNEENHLPPVRLKIVVEDKTNLDSNGQPVGIQTFDLPMSKYNKDWTPGNHYTYNITLTSHGIEFSAPTIENIDQKPVI